MSSVMHPQESRRARMGSSARWRVCPFHRTYAFPKWDHEQMKYKWQSEHTCAEGFFHRVEVRRIWWQIERHDAYGKLFMTRRGSSVWQTHPAPPKPLGGLQYDEYDSCQEPIHCVFQDSNSWEGPSRYIHLCTKEKDGYTRSSMIKLKNVAMSKDPSFTCVAR